MQNTNITVEHWPCIFRVNHQYVRLQIALYTDIIGDHFATTNWKNLFLILAKPKQSLNNLLQHGKKVGSYINLILSDQH